MSTKVDPLIFLSDGRKLCYREIGDPDGFPFVFFHGSPGSRLLQFSENEVRRAGLRQICFDRPGYGGSSPHTGRSLRTVSDDVADLLSVLGVESCGLVGWSAGGRFAVSAACRLGERSKVLALISSRGPLHEVPGDLARMDEGERQLVTLAEDDPEMVVSLVTPFFQGWIDRPTSFLADAPPPDDVVRRHARYWKIWSASLLEAFAQGGEAMAWDLMTHYRRWEADLDSIPGPTAIFRGARDSIVGPESNDWFMNRLRVKVNVEWPELGHLGLFPMQREILSTVRELTAGA